MGRPDLSHLLSRARAAWQRAGDPILAAAGFGLSLILYLRTLAPTVVALFDDSLEFPLAVHRMAIAHPTGYPLYLLLGKLVSLLPWRDVAGRVNLLSAIAGAAAVALTFLVARQLTRRRWTALLAAGLLAVSPVFWSQAVVAEVYTLNAAFVAGLLLAALRWARKPLQDPPPLVPPLRLAGRTEGEPPAPAAAPLPAEVDVREPAALGLPADRAEAAAPSPVAQAAQDATALRSSLERLRRAAVTGRLAGVARGLGRWAQPAALRAKEWLGAFLRRARPIYRRLLPEVPAEKRLRLHPAIYGLAALLGLALTHHRTVVLLAPALLLFLLLVERRVATRAALLGPERADWPRGRRLLARPTALLAACFFAPLLLYLYLPIRGDVGSLDGTYVNTWSGFWHWVSAGSYGAFLGDNPLARSMDAAGYAGLFWAQFGPVGLALAILGMAGLVRRPKVLALTGTAFLLYLLFGFLYRAPDLEVFFLPCFLIAAVWAGVGLDYALDLMRIRGRSLALRRLQGAGRLLLAMGAIAQAAIVARGAFPAVDLSKRWEAHDLAQYWLRPALAPEGTLVGLLGEVSLVRYFQETEGLAPGLRTVVADDPAARLAAVEAEIAQGRAVYITRSLEGLAQRASLQAVAGAIEVGGQAEALVRAGVPSYDTAHLPNPQEREVAPGVELLGYSLSEHSAHGQGYATLRLWWRAAQGMSRSLKVSARLVDARGEVAASIDGEPVAWTYPTGAWRPGEVVADAYEIPWPAGAAPGSYTPQVILYDPSDGQEQGRVELPAVSLSGSPRLPHDRIQNAGVARMARARFGEVRLLGLTPPDPAVPLAPGGHPAVVLLWQAMAPAGGDLVLEIRLEGVEMPVAATAVGGDYPSGRWSEGQVVRQTVHLDLPADLRPGSYRLRLRVIQDGRPVAWSRGIVPGGSDLDLGSYAVE